MNPRRGCLRFLGLPHPHPEASGRGAKAGGIVILCGFRCPGECVAKSSPHCYGGGEGSGPLAANPYTFIPTTYLRLLLRLCGALSLRNCILLLLACCLAACTNLSGEPEIAATLPPEAAQSRWMPDIHNGARLFAEHCTDCHGITGDGRGSLVLAGTVQQPRDLTDQALISAASPLEFFTIISEGRLEKLMPPWQAALSKPQRWDVALYAYTLRYDDALLAAGESLWQRLCAGCAPPDTIPPVYSDVAFGRQLALAGALADADYAALAAFLRAQSLQTPTVTITGTVQNGTADGLVPSDTVVQLQVGNPQSGYSVTETRLDAAGRFRFEQVRRADDLGYALGAVYAGRLFSLRLPLESLADEQTLYIYEATSDPRVITISRMDLRMAAARLEDRGAGLVVEQALGFRNESDRIYTSGRGFDDGREASLLMQLPAGASWLGEVDTTRYVVIEGLAGLPNSLIDTLPVPPGDQHEIAFAYFLPYADGLEFAQDFNNLLDADVTVALPSSLRIDGAFEQTESGVTKTYVGQLAMQQDPALRFIITDDPFATSSDDAQVITSEALLPLLLAAGGVLASAGGLALLLLRRPAPASAEINKLTSELAQLERDHDQGRINHDLYHHRRRELQARLSALREKPS
ncbi:MAG: cytochrome c [Chloroflexi bacterium]|nr:cytochrome c [Chloroflexota bacterium]MXX81908.1 cytochrome c [Chloroflexota bacterium]MYC55366.1 cytochrome c [Chloroflexota bacterium]MYE77913.1 cytochrome c [Chloroflexota bacterium]